jgi:hypothetical protein
MPSSTDHGANILMLHASFSTCWRPALVRADFREPLFNARSLLASRPHSFNCDCGGHYCPPDVKDASFDQDCCRWSKVPGSIGVAVACQRCQVRSGLLSRELACDIAADRAWHLMPMPRA